MCARMWSAKSSINTPSYSVETSDDDQCLETGKALQWAWGQVTYTSATGVHSSVTLTSVSLEPFCLGLTHCSLKPKMLWRNCLKALFQRGCFLSGSFQPVCVGCGDAPHTCASGPTVRAFSKPSTSIWLPHINIFFISWVEIHCYNGQALPTR